MQEEYHSIPNNSPYLITAPLPPWADNVFAQSTKVYHQPLICHHLTLPPSILYHALYVDGQSNHEAILSY